MASLNYRHAPPLAGGTGVTTAASSPFAEVPRPDGLRSTAILSSKPHLVPRAPRCTLVRSKDAAQRLQADALRFPLDRRTAAEAHEPGMSARADPAMLTLDTPVS